MARFAQEDMIVCETAPSSAARHQLIDRLAPVLGIDPKDPSLKDCLLDGDIDAAVLEALAGRGFLSEEGPPSPGLNSYRKRDTAARNGTARNDGSERRGDGVWQEMAGILGGVPLQQVVAQLRRCVLERDSTGRPASAKVKVVYPEVDDTARRRDRVRTAYLTLVSGFFDLGGVRSGSKFSEEEYLQWMQAYAAIDNQLLFFSDEVLFAQDLLLSRATLKNGTRTFLMRRSSLRSFRLHLDATRAALEKRALPYVKWPNMVVPEYCLTMHAKYDLLALALALNAHSKYIAWADVGYWRDIREFDERFSLRPPPELHPRRVAFTEVFRRNWAGKGRH